MTRKLTSFCLTAALLCLSALALSACNTVAGAGQDVSDIGHVVTHVAEPPPPK